jgi:hypothetical protein
MGALANVLCHQNEVRKTRQVEYTGEKFLSNGKK